MDNTCECNPDIAAGIVHSPVAVGNCCIEDSWLLVAAVDTEVVDKFVVGCKLVAEL